MIASLCENPAKEKKEKRHQSIEQISHKNWGSTITVLTAHPYDSCLALRRVLGRPKDFLKQSKKPMEGVRLANYSRATIDSRFFHRAPCGFRRRWRQTIKRAR